jgi:hypothetical protein
MPSVLRVAALAATQLAAYEYQSYKFLRLKDYIYTITKA